MKYKIIYKGGSSNTKQKFEVFNSRINLDLTKNIKNQIDFEYIKNFFKDNFIFDFNMTKTFMEYSRLNKNDLYVKLSKVKNNKEKKSFIENEIEINDIEFYRTFIIKYLKIQYDKFTAEKEEIINFEELDLDNLNIKLNNDKEKNDTDNFEYILNSNAFDKNTDCLDYFNNDKINTNYVIRKELSNTSKIIFIGNYYNEKDNLLKIIKSLKEKKILNEQDKLNNNYYIIFYIDENIYNNDCLKIIKNIKIKNYYSIFILNGNCNGNKKINLPLGLFIRKTPIKKKMLLYDGNDNRNLILDDFNIKKVDNLNQKICLYNNNKEINFTDYIKNNKNLKSNNNLNSDKSKIKDNIKKLLQYDDDDINKLVASEFLEGELKYDILDYIIALRNIQSGSGANIQMSTFKEEIILKDEESIENKVKILENLIDIEKEKETSQTSDIDPLQKKSELNYILKIENEFQFIVDYIYDTLIVKKKNIFTILDNENENKLNEMVDEIITKKNISFNNDPDFRKDVKSKLYDLVYKINNIIEQNKNIVLEDTITVQKEELEKNIDIVLEDSEENTITEEKKELEKKKDIVLEQSAIEENQKQKIENKQKKFIEALEARKKTYQEHRKKQIEEELKKKETLKKEGKKVLEELNKKIRLDELKKEEAKKKYKDLLVELNSNIEKSKLTEEKLNKENKWYQFSHNTFEKNDKLKLFLSNTEDEMLLVPNFKENEDYYEIEKLDEENYDKIDKKYAYHDDKKYIIHGEIENVQIREPLRATQYQLQFKKGELIHYNLNEDESDAIYKWKYEGPFKNNKPNGQGKLTVYNNDGKFKFSIETSFSTDNINNFIKNLMKKLFLSNTEDEMLLVPDFRENENYYEIENLDEEYNNEIDKKYAYHDDKKYIIHGEIENLQIRESLLSNSKKYKLQFKEGKLIHYNLNQDESDTEDPIYKWKYEGPFKNNKPNGQGKLTVYNNDGKFKFSIKTSFSTDNINNFIKNLIDNKKKKLEEYKYTGYDDNEYWKSGVKIYEENNIFDLNKNELEGISWNCGDNIILDNYNIKTIISSRKNKKYFESTPNKMDENNIVDMNNNKLLEMSFIKNREAGDKLVYGILNLNDNKTEIIFINE